MDPLETNVTHQQINSFSLGIREKVGSYEKGDKTFVSSVYNEHYPDDQYTLISCFYFLEDPASEPTSRYKEQFYRQGKKMLVIREVDEFLKHIRESIINLGFDPEMKRVIYYNPKTDNYPPDTLTPFHKSNEFAHQNEFRIGMRPFNFWENSLPACKSMRVPVPGLKELSFLKEIYS